jgi:tripartite-type tricarboxylate transporter receptor subunit TctC
MRHRYEFLLICLLLGSLTLLPHLAIAADWPNRSVTVIVPFGAGGNTDMMARLASQDLSAKFGQTFV